jgi:hypothetical protein
VKDAPIRVPVLATASWSPRSAAAPVGQGSRMAAVPPATRERDAGDLTRLFEACPRAIGSWMARTGALSCRKSGGARRQATPVCDLANAMPGRVVRGARATVLLPSNRGGLAGGGCGSSISRINRESEE